MDPVTKKWPYRVSKALPGRKGAGTLAAGSEARWHEEMFLSVLDSDAYRSSSLSEGLPGAVSIPFIFLYLLPLAHCPVHSRCLMNE